MELDVLRKRVSELDKQVISLLAERFEFTAKIGALKKSKGIKALDEKQKAIVLDKAKQEAQAKGLNVSLIEKLFEEVMKESVLQQSKDVPRVAFQGERGAYSEVACSKLFKDKILLPLATLEDVFEALEQGIVDSAVIPIENSTEGSVNSAYDLLAKHNFKISREAFVEVNHCLLAKHGVRLQDIKKVYSHPQALAQCRGFLLKNLPQAEIVSFYDTAGAARMASQSQEQIAAIASKAAGKYYNLTVLHEGIQDFNGNTTRFLEISVHSSEAGGEKTSIVLTLKHEAGSLYKALSIFAKHNLNLTNLQSRPLKDVAWQYCFFIDFQGSLGNASVKKALEELQSIAIELKILGSYNTK